MAKFIKKVLLFFAMIAIIDIACGFGYGFLRAHAKGGDTQKNYYISEQCCDDILILGSSRAARHYDSRVFEDSLGMSCYNCGEPGCGIITAYARYGMIEQRYKPKLVVYEITPGFDYFKTDDYSKYLGRIRQYSYKQPVYQINLELGDKFERYRLVSNMYRNNSFLVQTVKDYFITKEYDKGYEPLYGLLNKEAQQEHIQSACYEIDSVKFSYIERLIIELQKEDLALCFMVSPRYINQESASIRSLEYEPIIKLCDKYNVPFYNHIYVEEISNSCEYFQDSGHMNKKGSTIYSKYIVKDLNNLLLNK